MKKIFIIFIIVPLVASFDRQDLPSLVKSAEWDSYQILNCTMNLFNITSEEYQGAETLNRKIKNENEEIFEILSWTNRACELRARNPDSDDLSKAVKEVEEYRNDLNCFKMKLAEIDPNSELLKDFVATSADENDCNQLFSRVVSRTRELGKRFDEYKKNKNGALCTLEEFVNVEEPTKAELERAVMMLGNFSDEEKIAELKKYFETIAKHYEDKVLCRLRDFNLL